MTDTDLGTFLALRRHLKIAHHIPGRIRLKVGSTVFEELDTIDPSVFDRILHAIDGITDVRINKAAGSVIIAYAADTVDPDSWQTLINGEDDDARLLMTNLLNRATPRGSTAAQCGSLLPQESASMPSDGSLEPDCQQPPSTARDPVSSSLGKDLDKPEPSVAQTIEPLQEAPKPEVSRNFHADHLRRLAQWLGR